MFNDAYGQEVNVGDFIAYVSGKRLEIGVIRGLKTAKNYHGLGSSVIVTGVVKTPKYVGSLNGTYQYDYKECTYSLRKANFRFFTKMFRLNMTQIFALADNQLRDMLLEQQGLIMVEEIKKRNDR